MRCGEFRRQDYFFGSGPVEADSRTLVGSRLNRCGTFWTVKGMQLSPRAAGSSQIASMTIARTGLQHWLLRILVHPAGPG